MSDVTVRQLAEVVGIPLDRLLTQLGDAGLAVNSADDMLSDAEKLKLLSYLRHSHGKDQPAGTEPKKVTLQRRTVNELKHDKVADKNVKTVSVEVRKKRTYVKRSELPESDKRRLELEKTKQLFESAESEEVSERLLLVDTPSGTAILRGVLANTLGGFPVVRGFANLKILAGRSQADKGYQRELKPDHVEDIQQFYLRGEYLFFPEIVLSLELLADFNKNDKPSGDPVNLILQGQSFKSNVNSISVNINKTNTANELTRVTISLPEKAGKVLKRIDGNHRISAFEEMSGVERLESSQVSFCIILFNQGQATQNEKALFYNINSKALALTSEEVYKGIIEDEAGFPEDVLKSDFGPEFVLCRQIRKKLNFEYLSYLCCVFGQHKDGIDSRCSVLIESLRDIQRERQRLGNTLPLPDVKNLFTAIQAINLIYADAHLTTSTSQGLFSAFLYFQLQEGSLKRQFMQWVLKNHLYELKTIHASDLIRIFEKVAQSKKRQIFVSMQFTPDTKPNYEAIKGAVDDLNATHELDIKLREIRIDKFDTGFSYEINVEILSLIEESGFLIADLTAGNKNVYHEIGFLMGLNQGRSIPHENFLLLHNGSIGNAANDVGFNLQGIKQLRVNDTNSLREEVKRQIAIYFGLE